MLNFDLIMAGVQASRAKVWFVVTGGEELQQLSSTQIGEDYKSLCYRSIVLGQISRQDRRQVILMPFIHAIYSCYLFFHFFFFLILCMT